MRDDAYLLDMLLACRDITEFIEGVTFVRYQSDRVRRRAVEREIEIIGEAASRVSAEFRNEHPEIPWRKIIAQRNVLIHEYGEIIDERIYQIAAEHIPALLAQLEKLVPPDPSPDA